MTPILRLALVVLVASLVAGIAPGEVSAQSYPTKPLHMIVPFAAGGSPDIIGRMVAEDLGTALGQSVVVENRAGAGGNIAVQYVIDQPADGYTLLLGTSGNMAANKVLYRNLKFDTEVDLLPISVAYMTCNVLIVSATGPIKSVADLVAEAKKNPGALSFGSPGVGTAGHLIGELFKTTTGAQLIHVPYRGQSQVINDLLGGHLSMSFEVAATAIPGGPVRQDAGARGHLSAPLGTASGRSDLCRSRNSGFRAGRTGVDSRARQDPARRRA